MIAHTACIQRNDSYGKYDIGNYAGEERHQPGTNCQFRSLVFIGGHGSVKQDILIERTSNVIDEIKEDHPSDEDCRCSDNRIWNGKKCDCTDGFHDNTDEKKRFVFANLCPL